MGYLCKSLTATIDSRDAGWAAREGWAAAGPGWPRAGSSASPLSSCCEASNAAAGTSSAKVGSGSPPAIVIMGVVFSIGKTHDHGTRYAWARTCNIDQRNLLWQPQMPNLKRVGMMTFKAMLQLFRGTCYLFCFNLHICWLHNNTPALRRALSFTNGSSGSHNLMFLPCHN